jgi:tRNA modification GTPase
MTGKSPRAGVLRAREAKRVNRPGRSSDTIAAISTPHGKGAIAVVRISGENALGIARDVFEPDRGNLPENWASKRGVHIGSLRDSKRDRRIDRVVMLIMPGPGSYTGEDVVEFHCHGGSVTPRLVLRTLTDSGCRHARRGEFTLRAFLNDRLDLVQAESVLDIIESRSELAQREAVLRLEGSLSRILDSMRNGILELTARLEYFIDFPEEDDHINGLEGEYERAFRLKTEIEHLLDTAMDAESLEEGVLAVIAGAPNVGKSSLFNLLLETERAIVTPYPGTTRDAVEAVVEINEVPFRLIDTAGLRNTGDPIEKKGIEFSRKYMDGADMILFVIEANRNLNEDEEKFIEEYGNRCVCVVNKSDLGEKIVGAALSKCKAVVTISCQERTGVADLKKEIGLAAALAIKLNYDDEAPVAIRERHRGGLNRAKNALERFTGGLGRIPPEILAIELREAREALEEMTGKVTQEEILGKIFEDFCVGK